MDIVVSIKVRISFILDDKVSSAPRRTVGPAIHQVAGFPARRIRRITFTTVGRQRLLKVDEADVFHIGALDRFKFKLDINNSHKDSSQ